MVIPWYVFLWVIIVFLIYVNVSEIVCRNIVSDCIILYCHQNVYITFPPADFPAVMSLWCLRSLSCVVFIFIPSFCHISSSSPNALLISVHFYPSHSDLYQIYSLMGWVLKWSGDTGEFYWYKWQLSSCLTEQPSPMEYETLTQWICLPL